MDIENHEMASTGESISKLALALLSPQAGSTLLDIGSGLGNFLIEAYKRYPDTSLYGVEFNEDIYRESLSKLPKEINIRFDEAFTAYDLNEKFDRIFCHPPWMLENNALMNEYKPIVIRHDIKFQLRQTNDWLFCDLICRQLADNGIGIAILPLGDAINLAVRSAREDFIRQGWIKSVILLPNAIHDETPISTIMIVFSKGNKEIRMVDARNTRIKGRRQVSFSDENVIEIVNLCKTNTETENSRVVKFHEIEKNEFVLNPSRYTTDLPPIPYAVQLVEVIHEITRGAGLTSKERDELADQGDSGIYFLTVSDIENGSIKNNLSAIKEITPKASRYVLNDGDILLSKNGAPFKSAFYRDDGRRIIANGNMYVIRADESLINPYYLAAYLNSEIGQKHLENVAGGSMFLSLAINDLKKVPVPLPSLDVQNRFVAQYCSKMNELEHLRYLISVKEQEIKDLFIEEIEDRRRDDNI